MLKTILARLREPSTWSGLGILAMVVGVKSDTVHAIQEAMPHVIDGITAAMGLGAVLLAEKAK